MSVLKGLWPLGAGLVFLGLLGQVLPAVMNPYYFSILIYAGINITLASSLNLVNGLTGQFSMGHAGFMAVGGYVAAFMNMSLFMDVHFAGMPNFVSEGLFLFISLIVGGLSAAILGYVVGLPTLR